MSDQKIQVVFCTDGIFPHAVGGMQKHSLLLIEKLTEFKSLELIVIHPHEGISVFNNSAVHEIAIPKEKSSGKYLIDCYMYSKKVYETIKAYPRAVIYSQGLAVWRQIGKLKGRVIINPHGLESYQTLSTRDYLIGVPFRMIFNYLFRNAHKVVSLGGRLTKILNGVAGSEKIVVLPNAVNVPETINDVTANKTNIQLLFVGRFALNKGINILAEAVQQLNDEGYENRLVFNLVGKGPLFEEYKQKYNFPNLHFLGFASDDQLAELYKTNDVFVLPTLFEGMPTVVLEAMAHGMPVIVTDVGATLELVDSSNGFIIEKNSVASLKKAILEYMACDENQKKLLSIESYKKVKEKFTWDIVAEKHYQLFKEVNSRM